MTPRQLYALRKRKIQQMQWTEIMFSRLTAAVCNFGFARPKTPIEETAFMMHPFAPVTPEAIEHEREQITEAPGDTLFRLFQGLPPGIAQQV